MNKLLLLFIIFSSLPVYSGVTEKTVLTELMSIHGPNWNGQIESEIDRAKIKATLSRIIIGEIQLNYLGYAPEFHKEIIQNAMSEFGNFVSTDTKGHIIPEDKKVFDFYQQKISDLHKKEALAYYEGLKNAGSVDALELLSNHLTKTDDLATLYTIEKSLELSLKGSDGTKKKGFDHSHIKPFHPNIKGSYQGRKGNWEKAFVNIRKNLLHAESTVLRKSKSDSFKKSFSSLKNSIISLSANHTKATRNQPEKKVSLNTHFAPLEKGVKKESLNKNREISSENKKKEESGISSYVTLFITGLAFITFVWFRFFKS